MSNLGPYSRIEQLFIEGAERRLPVGDAKVVRDEHGVLSYFWPSPCDEVEGLWASVREHEVMLSTKISHAHVDRHAFLPEIRFGEVEDHHIVEQGIADVERILAGETTFSKTFSADGRQISSEIGHLAGVAEPLAYAREIFGEGITQRTWTWFGEVTGEGTAP